MNLRFYWSIIGFTVVCVFSLVTYEQLNNEKQYWIERWKSSMKAFYVIFHARNRLKKHIKNYLPDINLMLICSRLVQNPLQKRLHFVVQNPFSVFAYPTIKHECFLIFIKDSTWTKQSGVFIFMRLNSIANTLRQTKNVICMKQYGYTNSCGHCPMNC